MVRTTPHSRALLLAVACLLLASGPAAASTVAEPPPSTDAHPCATEFDACLDYLVFNVKGAERFVTAVLCWYLECPP
jgi:hypothetical protein